MPTTYVTVPGANNTSIVNPFNNTANTTLAQAISTYLFAAQTAGTLDVQNPPPPTPPAPPAGGVGEISVTTPGGQNIYVQVPTGFSFTAIDQGVLGPVYVAGGGSLFAGNQNVTYLGSAATGAVSIAAGDGTDYFNMPTGSTYFMALGNGNDTIIAKGSGTIVGGTGNNNINVGSQGSSDVLLSNGASDTIVAGAGNVTVGTFGANPNITGGVGNLVYFGGAAGHPTITGATGPGGETLFGGSGQNISYLDNPTGPSTGSAIFGAGSGNETLNAGGSSEGVKLAAGVGSVNLIGSTGPDTFFGGSGFATMTGNGGADVFVFGTTPVGHQGGTDIISDFNSNDIFLLSGYGSNGAANAFAGATVAGGNSFVKLSDGTSIEFLGINTTTGTWKTESY